MCLPGHALGDEAYARAFSAAYSALSTANQEAMVPLLACLRVLLAHAVHHPERLLSTLHALDLGCEGAQRGEMLVALAGALGRACWAALMDCRGGTAAAATTAAFLETALAPELFTCANAETRCALAVLRLPDYRHTSAKCSRRDSTTCSHTMPVPAWPVRRRGHHVHTEHAAELCNTSGARCMARAARCTGRSSSCGAWQSARPQPPR